MGIVALYIIYSVVRKGFKGALFQGKIQKTYGEFKTLPVSGMTKRIKIHELDGKPIGIEISGPFQITPIRIDKKDVSKLLNILEQARK